MPTKISIIIPCLNEEVAIATCLLEIKEAIRRYLLEAEVIVVDNNSQDQTANIVQASRTDFPELLLVREERIGYGRAYLKGLSLAKGDYIFMADADNTYDFSEIDKFISHLDAGADLVVGNRFSSGTENLPMPWLHRYIGNPFLSFLVKKIFAIKISDIHCGARALRRSSLASLDLRTDGMEFASEMIIKAGRQGLKITEIPIHYRPRLGESKLHSLVDGWRHLSFILKNIKK